MPDLKQELLHLKDLDPKRKFALFALTLFLFASGFTGGVLLSKGKIKVQLPVTIVPQSSPTKAIAPARFFLEPEKATFKLGQPFTLFLYLDSGDYFVESADLVLNYDPQLLTVEELKEGDFFKTYVLKKTTPGKILLSGLVLVEKDERASKGQGLMGTVTFTPLKEGAAAFSFDQEKSVIASRGQTVNGQLSGTTYEISNQP